MSIHVAPVRRAFTLIELLIVVAIIAILAAIAVPNFLEAQTRAKVSRAKADMRTLAIGMESYHVDFNAYLEGNSFGVAFARPGFLPPDPKIFERLSTPVAYLTTSLFIDPFVARLRSGGIIDGTGTLDASKVDLSKWTPTPTEEAPDHFLYTTYLYISTANGQGDSASNPSGLTRVENDDVTASIMPTSYIFNSASPMQAYVNAGGVVANSQMDFAINLIYDPTNGTVSFGQIWRSGGSPSSQNNIYGAINSQK